jgi:proteasome lid subunit RPN8/RPN11
LSRAVIKLEISLELIEQLIMTMILTAAQLKIIYNHAESIYPEECCGILLGKITGSIKTTVEVIPTINAWEQSKLASEIQITDQTARTKTSRYVISPRDIFQAQKRGRDLQLEIIGFFHSHPDCSATPSNCDREQAWEIYSYPIVSVMQGKVCDLQSWVLDHNDIFQPEKIHQAEQYQKA